MAGTLAGKMKAVKHAFSSRQAFMKAIEVENTLVEGEARYMNPDPQWMNVGKCRRVECSSTATRGCMYVVCSIC